MRGQLVVISRYQRQITQNIHFCLSLHFLTFARIFHRFFFFNFILLFLLSVAGVQVFLLFLRFLQDLKKITVEVRYHCHFAVQL